MRKKCANKNNQWAKNEIKEEIGKHLKINENRNIGHSKSNSKREVYSNIGLLQETRKISNKQLNLPSKGIIKRRTKPEVSRRKEIINNREEINKIDKTQ